MQCADPELQAAAGDAVVVPADLADELLRVLMPEAHAQDRSSARLLLHLAVFRSTCRPLRLVRLSAGRSHGAFQAPRLPRQCPAR